MCSVVSIEKKKNMYKYLTPNHSPKVKVVFQTPPFWNRHRGVKGSHLVKNEMFNGALLGKIKQMWID